VETNTLATIIEGATRLLTNTFSRIIVSLLISIVIYGVLWLTLQQYNAVLMGAAIPSITALTALIERMIDRLLKENERTGHSA